MLTFVLHMNIQDHENMTTKYTGERKKEGGNKWEINIGKIHIMVYHQGNAYQITLRV